MTHLRIVPIAAVLVIAQLVTGCKDHSHDPISSAALDKIERDECLGYVNGDKDADLLWQCLLKKQLPPDRVAEAQAVIARAAKVRADAVDKLGNADPAVLALMKQWAAAKGTGPTVFVGINVAPAEPVQLMYGGSYTSEIVQNEIAIDLRSMAKEKLPGVDFGNGGTCDPPPYELDFAVTYAVRDSGDIDQLRHGNDTVGVHVLSYDFDIVARYEDHKTTVVSVKDRKFPLPDGYTEQSDSGSAEFIGMKEMDRHAAAFVEGTIQAALGL